MRKGIFSHIIDRIAGVPHRSVAAIPYGQWFSLYVQCLKAHQRNTAAGRDANELKVARQNLDVSLLSSVVSQKWTEVIVPSDDKCDARQPRSSVGNVLWWHESAEGAWLSSNNKIRGLELVTTSFLLEPLLAGRSIAAWTETVQQSSAAGGPLMQNDKGQPSLSPNKSGVLVVVVPFSTLFQLRAEAYSRAHTASADGENTQQRQLSLQERRARVAVLNSLHQLMELQCNSNNRWTNVEFAIWSPVSEFDAIMHISQVRLSLPDAAKKRITLETVCECEATRSAYLAHYLTLTKKNVPLAVLAPQSRQTELQQVPITNSCVRAQSACESEVRRQGHLKRSTVHRQAVTGCSELVRRMATREENLRQIMIP